MTAQRGADREKDQAAFLRLVDDLETEAASAAHAIEKQLAVSRFADRARGHGSNVLDAVRVDDVAEAVERGKGRVGRLRADHAA